MASAKGNHQKTRIESKTFTHQKQLSDLVCFYIRQDASQNEAIMKTTLESLKQCYGPIDVIELNDIDRERFYPLSEVAIGLNTKKTN